ncbi:MAG: LysR family transcriptional regulator [Oscillibacter sp.]|nr:LysR family transcriptional regulator [Oscillibacter sp.]
MTFQQLSYVVEISRCGSINKAAHKLCQSQSGISTAVRELEEELGIRFFLRTSRGVAFTPEGTEFLSYAVSLLEQKERIEGLYRAPQSAPARFAVSTQRYPFTEDAFLRLLETLAEPCYHYTLKELGMDAVIDDVYDHRADIGVIFLTELTEKMIRRLLASRELEFHEVAAVAPCIYVRKGHPLAGAEQVTDEALEGYPYVSFEHAQGVASDFSEEYQELQLRRPERCIVVNNRATMMNVLTRTDAYTTGSGLLVESLISQQVVTVPLAGKRDIRIGWIVPKNAAPSPRVEQFAALLEQSVAESIRFTAELHRSLGERT